MTKVIGLPYILKIDRNKIKLSVLGKGRFVIDEENYNLPKDVKKCLYKGLEKASAGGRVFGLLPALPRNLFADNGVRKVILESARNIQSSELASGLAIMLARTSYQEATSQN